MSSDFLGAVGRRWYVLVLALSATVVIGLAAPAIAPPTYTARGLVLLLPPEDLVDDGGNPFLALGALEGPARLIVSYLDSSSARSEVEATASAAEYTVSIDESTRGPVIAIDVADATADGAISTLHRVADEIPAALEQLQQELDVPPDAAVTSMSLTMSTEAEEDTATTTTVTIVAVVLGLVGAVALTLATDRLLLRRTAKQRRRGRRESDNGSADHAPVGIAEDAVEPVPWSQRRRH